MTDEFAFPSPRQRRQRAVLGVAESPIAGSTHARVNVNAINDTFHPNSAPVLSSTMLQPPAQTVQDSGSTTSSLLPLDDLDDNLLSSVPGGLAAARMDDRKLLFDVRDPPSLTAGDDDPAKENIQALRVQSPISSCDASLCTARSQCFTSPTGTAYSEFATPAGGDSWFNKDLTNDEANVIDFGTLQLNQNDSETLERLKLSANDRSATLLRQTSSSVPKVLGDDWSSKSRSAFVDSSNKASPSFLRGLGGAGCCNKTSSPAGVPISARRDEASFVFEDHFIDELPLISVTKPSLDRREVVESPLDEDQALDLETFPDPPDSFLNDFDGIDQEEQHAIGSFIAEEGCFAPEGGQTIDGDQFFSEANTSVWTNAIAKCDEFETFAVADFTTDCAPEDIMIANSEPLGPLLGAATGADGRPYFGYEVRSPQTLLQPKAESSRELLPGIPFHAENETYNVVDDEVCAVSSGHKQAAGTGQTLNVVENEARVRTPSPIEMSSFNPATAGTPELRKYVKDVEAVEDYSSFLEDVESKCMKEVGNETASSTSEIQNIDAERKGSSMSVLNKFFSELQLQENSKKSSLASSSTASSASHSSNHRAILDEFFDNIQKSKRSSATAEPVQDRSKNAKIASDFPSTPSVHVQRSEDATGSEVLPAVRRIRLGVASVKKPPIISKPQEIVLLKAGPSNVYRFTLPRETVRMLEFTLQNVSRTENMKVLSQEILNENDAFEIVIISSCPQSEVKPGDYVSINVVAKCYEPGSVAIDLLVSVTFPISSMTRNLRETFHLNGADETQKRHPITTVNKGVTCAQNNATLTFTRTALNHIVRLENRSPATVELQFCLSGADAKAFRCRDCHTLQRRAYCEANVAFAPTSAKRAYNAHLFITAASRGEGTDEKIFHVNLEGAV